MSDASLKYRVERLEEMLEFVKSVSMWRSTDPLAEQRGRAIARMINERLGESPNYVPVPSWRELMLDAQRPEPDPEEEAAFEKAIRNDPNLVFITAENAREKMRELMS